MKISISNSLTLLLGFLLLSCGSNSFDERMAGIMELEGSTYEVYLLGNDSLTTTGYFYCKRIELRESSNATPFLVIDSLDHPAWGEHVLLEDMNFDGYPDIAIHSEEPYIFDPYSLWLYNPESKTFNYNNFLEDASGETYWIDEAKQIMISSFDRGETRTSSFYAFEDGGFVLVEEEVVVDGSLTMGFAVTTLSKREGGKMQITNTITSAGGLELKKSGTISDKDDIKSFLRIFGDGAVFQPIIKNGSTISRYHDTCMKRGFTLKLEPKEKWETRFEKYYPILDWEEMYEGPDEMSSIEKISYRSSGKSFTLDIRRLLDEYDGSSDESTLHITELYETLAATYDKDNYRWVFRYLTDYDEFNYMHSDQTENLPMDDEECGGYGENY